MKVAELPQWLDIATEAALVAGAVLKKYWGNLTEIVEKELPGDLVTEADRQADKVIVSLLQRKLPDHQFLAEESGYIQTGSPSLWAIDPIDGTTNYAHQYPMAAISIGLMQNQELLLGVVYNPFTEEVFRAAKGFGATLNDQSIQVSKVQRLEKSLLATGFPYDRRTNPDNNYAEFAHLTNLTQGVRRAGAASLDLAYVACGRLDGYWEKGLKIWDIAAGALIVQEAGGKVSDYDLGPLKLESGRILASNGHIHEAMSHELLSFKGPVLPEYWNTDPFT